jgi:hypothetical protein
VAHAGHTEPPKPTTTDSASRLMANSPLSCPLPTPLAAAEPTTVTPMGVTAGKLVTNTNSNTNVLDTPWDWFKSTGVVTGGDFKDTDTCYAYTMPFCAHHVTGTGLPNCSDIQQVDPKCSKKCANGATYSADKHRATSSYALQSVDSIKRDVLQYGPVTAAFTVYEVLKLDFNN